MLSKEVSSSIFKVFGMTRPGIEPRSPRPLANTLTAGPKYEVFGCLKWLGTLLNTLALKTFDIATNYEILFWLWFFRLLSSSLLLLVETHNFSHLPRVSLVYLGIEMIQPGKSFLSFACWSNKVFRNLWRSYSNNDVIVFHIYQSERWHEMNLKFKIQSHQLFLIFLK